MDEKNVIILMEHIPCLMLKKTYITSFAGNVHLPPPHIYGCSITICWQVSIVLPICLISFLKFTFSASVLCVCYRTAIN